LRRQENGSAGGADYTGEVGGDTVRGEAVIVANQQSLASVLIAHGVARDGLRNDPGIREGKILSDYAAPAVGAEFDGGHDAQLYAKGLARQQPHWPTLKALTVKLESQEKGAQTGMPVLLRVRSRGCLPIAALTSTTHGDANVDYPWRR